MGRGDNEIVSSPWNVCSTSHLLSRGLGISLNPAAGSNTDAGPTLDYVHFRRDFRVVKIARTLARLRANIFRKMFALVAKVILLLALVAVACAQNDLFPDKPDKWAIECATVSDCKVCGHNLITICMSGYCGCKKKYHFG